MNRASVPAVHSSAFIAFSLIVVGLGLSNASCGPTCPDGQESCGSAGAAGAAGAAGSAGTAGGTATCAELTAVQTCMDAFCTGSSNPFCACYQQHADISTKTCACVPFDPQKFCDQAAANGIDAANYDCSAASSSVATICVGVP